MSKVILVSKTHLDLGFTNLAKDIVDQYLQVFIPNAVSVAREVNREGKKFVWTVGSWILNEALENGTEEQRAALADAVEHGDIVAHAYPFTTHTELIDRDTLEYGLSIIKKLDRQFHRHTISAKMTDVPGHTVALVPILADAGIRLLHIGVNGASAMPHVPECFLWRHSGREIVVIYDGSYGGAHCNPYIGDILYFDHSLDNHGPGDVKSVLENYERVRQMYPDHEVVAGSLDDYAALLWEVRDQLPVVTSEIGDTWIHGAAADPYKLGAIRTLSRLKERWLSDGSLLRDSNEYRAICNGILCAAEHTWGVDSKIFLGDYYNYLRRDFDEARKKDIKIKRGGIYRLPCAKRLREKGPSGGYSAMESSWKEQREYIDSAVEAMTDVHRTEAQSELERLIPKTAWTHGGEPLQTGKTYGMGAFEISVNDFGGIGCCTQNGTCIIGDNRRPLLEYRSYGYDDYTDWLRHYTRNYAQTKGWATGDFARPNLKKVNRKFPQGVFPYRLSRGSCARSDGSLVITADLTIDKKYHTELGAPKKAQVRYLLDGKSVRMQFQWLDKPANRLTESITLSFYPNMDGGSLRLVKCGTSIDPLDVVKNGNRKISAAEACSFAVDGRQYCLKNPLSPLVTSGAANILHFDNRYNDYERGGLSFLLQDNVWGTNFPLWYGENAYFEYKISECIPDGV